MTNIIFNIVFGIVGYLFFGMLYVKLMHKLMQTKNPTIVNMVDGFFVRNFEEEKLQEIRC